MGGGDRSGEDFTVRVTDDPDSPLLDRFFEGYDRAFVLPDEREERAGFAACLALNRRSFDWMPAPRRELVLVAQNGAGTLLGGANFLATLVPDAGVEPPIAIALNYLYVEPHARGGGLTRRLLAAVRAHAATALDVDRDTPAVVFIEQNDPLRLTPAAYANDTRVAGIDQIDRLAIWARLGARLVDIAYVQPALSAAQAADDGLVYSAIGAGGDRMSAAYLGWHLRSFFGISVLKGRDPSGDPVAARLLGALAAVESVGLIGIAPALDRLRSDPDAKRGARSLRRLAQRLAA